MNEEERSIKSSELNNSNNDIYDNDYNFEINL